MASADFFSIFSLPRHLQIDVQALEQVFYAQSRKLHPDRFASRSASEQDAALADSSRLNDAYRTLKDPVARTKYLLSLEGVELEEQSSSATKSARVTGLEKKQLIPPELLEEVFELNMQLMEMKAAREFGDKEDPQLRLDLQRTAAEFNAKMSGAQRELESLWVRWDSAEDRSDENAKASVKDELVALLNKRSYLRNLIRDVTQALE